MIISQYEKPARHQELDGMINQIAKDRTNRIINEYLTELVRIRDNYVRMRLAYAGVLRDTDGGQMDQLFRMRINELTTIINRMEKEVKE